MEYFENAIIDKIERNRISGWIDRNLTQKVTLHIHFFGKTAAFAPRFYSRPDISAERVGFEVETPDINLNIFDILEKNISFSFSCENENFSLKIWKLAYAKALLQSLSPQDRKLLNKLLEKENIIILQNKENICNDVLIGKEGHLFLFSGSNNLSAQYTEQKESFSEQIDNLIKIFEHRYHFCTTQEIDFLQIVIPEKTSILNKYTGIDIPLATPRYKYFLEQTTRKRFIPNIYETLLEKQKNENTFEKGDTHCTTAASALMTREICKRLSIDIDFSLKDTDIQFRTGGLLSLLTSSAVYKEPYTIAGQLLVNNIPMTPACYFKRDPEQGHLGITRKFINQNAPVNKRVLCFGNSFFERGGTSRCLTWFFARLFREFIFIWSPVMEKRIILKEQPDIVLCQTIERFLYRIPKSVMDEPEQPEA